MLPFSILTLNFPSVSIDFQNIDKIPQVTCPVLIIHVSASHHALISLRIWIIEQAVAKLEVKSYNSI